MAAPTTTQTFLERLSLRLSQDAGDEVTDYTANGITFLAINREEVINRIVKDIYDEVFKAFLDAAEGNVQNAAEKMIDAYQAFNHTEVYNIAVGVPDSSALSKAAKIKRVKTILVNTTPPPPIITNKVALPLTADEYHRAISNAYSNYKPTNDRPRFYEKSDSIELLIDTVGGKVYNGTLKAICLKQPVYQAFDIAGDDIIADPQWENKIINLAKITLLSGRQA